MKKEDIIQYLPYSKPFLFVDGLEHIDEEKVTGHYTFHPGMDFYKGHFKDSPVTPGVILTEVMAQIGLACLGIFLLGEKGCRAGMNFAMTGVDVAFLHPVYPGEKVTVAAEKMYFRFGKLKCRVCMKNQQEIEVCTGTVAGMIIQQKK